MASTKFIPQRKTKSTAIQLGKLRGFQIPDSIDEWEEIIFQNPHLRKLTINTLPSDFIASASKASESQYLMLRSFREFTMSARDIFDGAIEFGFTPAILQSAEDILERSMEWSRFLQLVGTPTSIDDVSEHCPGWPGSFAVVRRLHEQIMKVDGISDRDQNHPELPIAEDEATVNAAAIVFLQTISHLVKATPPTSKLEWVHNRVHLTCGVVNEFEAFTDGVLRSKRGDNKFSIVETKKASRGQDPKRISIQETCQLASWHMEESSTKEACFNGHLLLVSQDRHELYLTFAELNANYNAYLKNTGGQGFLKMIPVGPFNIDKPGDLQKFGKIIVAATIIARSVT